MKFWKTAERCVAELLGECRVPCKRPSPGLRPDVEHERLNIEVKPEEGGVMISKKGVG